MRSVSPHHSRASRHRAPTPHTPSLGIIRAGGVRVVFAASFNAFASSGLMRRVTQQRIKGILCFLEGVNGFLVELGAIRGFKYALPVLLQFTPPFVCRNAMAVLNSDGDTFPPLSCPQHHPARIDTASSRACRYF